MNREFFERVKSLWNQASATDISKTFDSEIQSQKPVSFLADQPFLALPELCCQAAEGDPLLGEYVSSAWGILHYAAYLLDGVADGETPVSESGVSNTLAAACIASAGLLLTAENQTINASHTFQIIQWDFLQTILVNCNGQINDLTRTEPTLDQCWQMSREKTGEFFALASRSGARVATEDQERIDRFSDLGLHLGMLIQIGDDMNGLWPENDRRSDLSCGKWTLPVAYTMEVSSNSIRDQLQQSLSAASRDPNAEAKARRIIIESGAMLYLVTQAKWHYSQAESSLMKATLPGQARDKLLSLLDLAVPKRGL